MLMYLVYYERIDQHGKAKGVPGGVDLAGRDHRSHSVHLDISSNASFKSSRNSRTLS